MSPKFVQKRGFFSKSKPPKPIVSIDQLQEVPHGLGAVKFDMEIVKRPYLNDMAQTDRASATHTIRSGHLRDLENYVKGHSRSLETEPLDRSYTTYY